MSEPRHTTGDGQWPVAERSAVAGGGGLWRRHSCRRVLATFQSPVPAYGKASGKSAGPGTRTAEPRPGSSPAPAGEGSSGEDIPWFARKHPKVSPAFPALSRTNFCFLRYWFLFLLQIRVFSRNSCLAFFAENPMNRAQSNLIVPNRANSRSIALGQVRSHGLSRQVRAGAATGIFCPFFQKVAVGSSR